MKPKLIIILVVVILALIVLFQNTHVVTFHFLLWHPEVSQIVLVLLMLGLGFVAGFIVAKWKGKD